MKTKVLPLNGDVTERSGIELRHIVSTRLTPSMVNQLWDLELCADDRVDLGGEAGWRNEYRSRLSTICQNRNSFMASYRGCIEALFGFLEYPESDLIAPWWMGSGVIRKEKPITAMRLALDAIKDAMANLGTSETLWVNETQSINDKHIDMLFALGFSGKLTDKGFKFYMPTNNTEGLRKYV